MDVMRQKFKPTFDLLKFNKKFRFIVFVIDSETKNIKVESTGERSLTIDDLRSRLPDRNLAFVVFDYEFVDSDGTPNNRVTFIYWLPDGAKIKERMQSATAKETLKNALDITNKEMIANDKEELVDAVFREFVGLE